MDQAITHCTKGIGRWEPACNDEGVEPDVVMASAGEAPEKRTAHHLSTSGGRVQGLWVTSTVAAGITENPTFPALRDYFSVALGSFNYRENTVGVRQVLADPLLRLPSSLHHLRTNVRS
jgi:hypothetical protein